MRSYQVEHAVPVRVTSGGREHDAHVAVSIADDNGTRIFGLVDPHDQSKITFMSYGLDYFEPVRILAAMRSEGVDAWRFLATGSDTTDVKISYRELEVALYRLKLIDKMGEDT